MRLSALAAALLLAAPALPQMTVEEYEPKSSLVVPGHPLTRARFPFVDVHNHQNNNPNLDQLVAEMDKLNLRVMVQLSGGYGERLAKNVKHLKARHPDRFVVFANLDFSNIDAPDYGRRAAAQLEADVKAGAQGLKLFKNFGMDVRDTRKRRIPVDDERFAPVWATCARLKLPVLIHTADPKQFWEPMDKNNERWLELKLRPNRARAGRDTPPFETLLAEQHRLFAGNPQTIFINAHLGWLGGDLDRLGQLLDRCPNVMTEIGAVLAELGRQPRFARQFFVKYQDRILMGKDSWSPVEYHTYFRVLETADEYFDYYRRYHAHWKMYGLDLPDEVLRKVYYQNALRLIPGLSAAGFPQ